MSHARTDAHTPRLHAYIQVRVYITPSARACYSAVVAGTKRNGKKHHVHTADGTLKTMRLQRFRYESMTFWPLSHFVRLPEDGAVYVYSFRRSFPHASRCLPRGLWRIFEFASRSGLGVRACPFGGRYSSISCSARTSGNNPMPPSSSTSLGYFFYWSPHKCLRVVCTICYDYVVIIFHIHVTPEIVIYVKLTFVVLTREYCFWHFRDVFPETFFVKPVRKHTSPTGRR